MSANVTDATLSLMKATLNDPLKKSVALASGAFGVDLSGPAKVLVPVWTPLRNILPRIGGGFGLSYQWRAVTSTQGAGVASMPWVPEGQRGPGISYQADLKSAQYVTLGIDDGLTYESISASQGAGFENAEADFKLRMLQRLMMQEENAFIGGNASLTLGTPTTPTLSAGGSGATLPGSPTTYGVYVVALTQEALGSAGGFGLSINNVLAAGLVQAKTVTGNDGKTYVVNGGSSQKSAQATQAITLGEVLTATTPVVNGAVAYAWYVGTSGNETLQAITTTNKATFSAPLTGGRQAISAITADCSKNATLAFDGFLSTVFNTANGAYVQTLATGNTGLTAGGDGGCVEIDTQLQTMWDQFGLSPDLIVMNSQEQRNLKKKILTYAGASLLRANQQADATKLNPLQISAGSGVQQYFNPFMPAGNNTSGSVMPVLVHPNMPPGTILFMSSRVPPTYQSANVTAPAEVRCRRDYYTVPWADTTRQRNQGVYSEETLAVPVPFAFGAIRNIANA